MLNKVILIGRLGADPEVRFMPSGGQVTTIRLATSRRWRDKQTNERKEETEWHRVVFFSRLAEVAGEYLKKGSQVYVEDVFGPRSGKDRTDKTATRPKSSRKRCICWIAAAAAPPVSAEISLKAATPLPADLLQGSAPSRCLPTRCRPRPITTISTTIFRSRQPDGFCKEYE